MVPTPRRQRDPVTPLRVTRSRSQTPALQEEHEVSRVPSLDVLSEDEEEAGEVTVRDHAGTLQEKYPPALSSREWRWVWAFLLLLLLLAGTSALVSRLQGEGLGEGVRERVVVVLAYSMAPLRALVEAARLVTAREVSLPLPGDLDYDLLATRILESDRFRAIVERVSGEKVERLGLQLLETLEEEAGTRRRGQEEEKQQYMKLEGEIKMAKEEMVREMQKAKEEAKKASASGQEQGLVTDVSIKSLDDQIVELQGSLARLQDQALAAGPAEDSVEGRSSQQVLEEIVELQGRLGQLEKAGQESAVAVKKCCTSNTDISRAIEDKMNLQLHGELSALKEQLKSQFQGQAEVDEMVTRLTADMKETVNEAIKRVSEDTRLGNMQYVNDQISSLRTNLVRELEANLSSLASPAPSQTPVASISSPQEVARIVREALTKYDADKTGLFDFALESAGGSIVTTKCTEPYQATSAVMSVWGLPIWWDANSPRTILQPGSAPGQCWAFRGSYGTVVVKLSSPIFVSAVTIEHISPLLSPDGHIYSAPNSLSLSGLKGENLSSLLNFTYLASGDPVQTFWLGEEARTQRFETVELTVHKNHGHPDYTCLYRVRVHGAVRQGGSGLH